MNPQLLVDVVVVVALAHGAGKRKIIIIYYYCFSFSIGAGESGKSTIVKQMKWDYTVWFYSWQPQQLNVQ